MEKKRKKRKSDEYGDWLIKMYPDWQEESKTNDLLTKTFTFQLTDKCNLACSYCYQINKGTRRLSFEDAKLCVDKLLSGEDGFGEFIGESKGIILDFIGGEPFLEVELMDKIVDYFKMRAIELNHPWAIHHMISVCSNGVLYRDPKVQQFLQKNARHMSFNVTVDGTQKLHDSCRVFPDGKPSYHLAHDAAMDWRSKGYDMGSKITLAPSNIVYTSECLKQMISDGYDEINANCVFEKGWEEEHATELYNQCKEFSDWMEENQDKYDYNISLLDATYTGTPMSESDNKNWCGTTGYMLAVDPDGRLFSCIRFMESSLGNDLEAFSIGNVHDGIGKTKEELARLKCLNCITRRSQTEDSCFYCPIASGCAHCTAYNYQVFGTPNKKATFICEMHKARCLAINNYWNTYYLKHGIKEVIDLWVPKQWAVPIIGEEEYNRLKDMTLKLGGKVNEDKEIIKGYKSPIMIAEEEYQRNRENC